MLHSFAKRRVQREDKTDWKWWEELESHHANSWQSALTTARSSEDDKLVLQLPTFGVAPVVRG